MSIKRKGDGALFIFLAGFLKMCSYRKVVLTLKNKLLFDSMKKKVIFHDFHHHTFFKYPILKV